MVTLEEAKVTLEEVLPSSLCRAKKERDALQEVKYTMQEISSSINTGDFPLSEDSFKEMSMHYYAICLTIVEILDGASYLFNKEKPNVGSVEEKEERLKQLLDSLTSPV